MVNPTKEETPVKKKTSSHKSILLSLIAGLSILGGQGTLLAAPQAGPSKAPAETIRAALLSDKWDKTFPVDKRVNHKKVTFHNRYGITLVGDVYTPKSAKAGEKFAAIALAGPYGAVKEQVSGRYAQNLQHKELLIIPGTVHLYYRMDVIPFARIEQFSRTNLH